MPDIAIKVENLSKCYRIGLKEQMSETLGGAIGAFLKAPMANLRQLRRLTVNPAEYDLPSEDLIWALNGVSFEVKEGEVLGVIGRNGAGKSTLLKIISRIVEPTAGRVEINGRVASLLEIGTGFHPELTGRENVYLNGAVLGMSKKEIDRKFDAIVDFAEVEKFMDTPIKRYSSGMKVRLAFAVAAHLEPEILLIDEVLAVGDALFQKKCVGKMGDISKRGRTVIFVSHNMAAIQNLCGRVIIINNGKLEKDSTAENAISHYLKPMEKQREQEKCLSLSRASHYQPIITDVQLMDRCGNIVDTMRAGGELTIRIYYASLNPLTQPSFGIGLDSAEGNRLILFQTKVQYGPIGEIPQSGIVNCRIPSLPLAPGAYSLTFGVAVANQDIDRLESALNFKVVEADFYGTGKLPGKDQGKMLVLAEWSFE